MVQAQQDDKTEVIQQDNSKKRIRFYQRKFFVNIPLQAEIIAYFMVILFIVFGFLFFAVHRTFKYLGDPDYVEVLPYPAHNYYDVLASQKYILNLVLAFGFVASVGFVFIGLMILSNRIAGPIKRLSDVLKAYSKGEKIKEVTLRKHDFFHDLAETVNDIARRQNK